MTVTGTITPEETWALVVAVESYPLRPELNLDGPFPDACDFTRWLRSRGVPPRHIYLLASPLDKNQSEAIDLQGEGVVCRTNDVVTHESVEEILKRLRKKTGMMIIFWSGHGIMTADRTRRPLLANYSEQDKHTLNIESLCRHLSSVSYGYPADQVLLFDICGTRFDALWHRQTLPEKTFPSTAIHTTGCRQWTFFASEDGQAADNVTLERTGLYYRELRAILEADRHWPPNLENANMLVRERLRSLQSGGETVQSPIRYYWQAPSGDREDIDIIPRVPTRTIAQEAPSRTYFIHRLQSARDFQERPEFTDLCNWYHAKRKALCALIGMGGAGKTAIVHQLLSIIPGILHGKIIQQSKWQLTPPRIVFVFSFYESSNPETFFRSLAATMSLDGSGKDLYYYLIAKLTDAPSMLLVLDGLERVQHDGSKGTILGQLQDSNLRDLLLRFADGLYPQHQCLVTTRFRPFDVLNTHGRQVQLISIESLPITAAIALLRTRGVKGNESTLEQIARQYGLHALTIDLLGGYLAHFENGNPGRIMSQPGFHLSDVSRVTDEIADPVVDPRIVEISLQEHRLARVAGWYREKLEQTDPAALALLERTCLFRQGATQRLLSAVFTGAGKISISGSHLAPLNKDALNRRLRLLTELRLLESVSESQDEPRYSSHPAIRDSFLMSLDKEVAQSGHRAVRMGLEASLGQRPGVAAPSDYATLNLLEEIVHHTVESGDRVAAWGLYQNRLGGFDHLGWFLSDHERGERICREIANNQNPRSAELDQLALPDALMGHLLLDWGAFLLELGHISEARYSLQHARHFLQNPTSYIDTTSGGFLRVIDQDFQEDDVDAIDDDLHSDEHSDVGDERRDVEDESSSDDIVMIDDELDDDSAGHFLDLLQFNGDDSFFSLDSILGYGSSSTLDQLDGVSQAFRDHERECHDRSRVEDDHDPWGFDTRFSGLDEAGDPSIDQEAVYRWIETGLWQMRACELEGRLRSGIAQGTDLLKIVEASRQEYGSRFPSVRGSLAYLLALEGRIDLAQFHYQSIEWHELLKNDEQDDVEQTKSTIAIYDLMTAVRQSSLQSRLGLSSSAIAGSRQDVRLARLFDAPMTAPVGNFLRLARADVLIRAGKSSGASKLLNRVSKRVSSRSGRHNLPLMLCTLAKLQAQLAIAKISVVSLQRKPRFAAEARDRIEEALRIARRCGLAIEHIDLLILRSVLSLYCGRPHEAESDARVALYGCVRAVDGEDPHACRPQQHDADPRSWQICPPESSGWPELLAANHPDCQYNWGEAAARLALGESLLLHIAQVIGSSSYKNSSTALTSELRQLLTAARVELTRSQLLKQKITKQKDIRISQILIELGHGTLTHYPLSPSSLPIPSE